MPKRRLLDESLEHHLKWAPIHDDAAFRLASTLRERDPDIRVRLPRDTTVLIAGQKVTVPEYVSHIVITSWRHPGREAVVYVSRGGTHFTINTMDHSSDRVIAQLNRAVAFLLTYFTSDADAFDGLCDY